MVLLNCTKQNLLRIKIIIFFFLMISTAIPLALPLFTFSSANNAEQWVNLTNQFFYGNQDFLFSYGPLYWIVGGASAPYNFSIWIITALFFFAYCTIFWILLIELAFKYHATPALAILYFLFIRTILFAQIIFLLPIIIVYYLELMDIDKYKILHSLHKIAVLSFFTALLFYIRFVYGTIGLLVFATYFISLCFDKLHYKSLAAYVGFCVLFYFILGYAIFHHTNSIYNYFIINNQLSFGNSIEMPEDISSKWIMWLLIAALFLLQNYSIRKNKFLILTVNLLFLILLKLGFSRIDHYYKDFISPMSIVLFIIVLQRSKEKFLYFPSLITLLLIVITSPFPMYFYFLQSTVQNTPFSTGRHGSYQDRMGAIYQNYHLPLQALNLLRNNTIDFYPYTNEYAFANNLNYDHRPIFQSFMTLSPRLDQINQQFFNQKNAPSFILWSGPLCVNKISDCNWFLDVDNRYTLNIDPLTIDAILTNYHLVEKINANNNSILILKKTTSTVLTTSIFITKQTMQLNKWYTVPVAPNKIGIIKLIPHLQFTLFGKLQNMLFRGDVVNIRYKLKNGKIEELPRY
ncbi:MAG: hypothetical protein NTV32_07575 [Gammaproteobacteria bacterium]|nr:hypothetical protein [Gammaproteobacteria bacterium]